MTNPILILRSELLCLIILMFISRSAKKYKISDDNKNFGRLLAFAVIHIIFDIITVITVNLTQVVPTMLNNFLHICFYLSALAFSSEFLLYVLRLSKPDGGKKQVITAYLFVMIYAVIVWFLPITYEAGKGTYSSGGIAAYLGYGCAFINFIHAFIQMVVNRKKLKANVMQTLFPMTFVGILLVFIQVFVRELLFTGGAVTIITVGMFFSSENPAQVFQNTSKEKAMDSIKSFKQYEEDMITYNKEHELDKSKVFICVRVAINNLVEVNDNLGHAVGDDYISLVVNSASTCFENATAIYRKSGQDFIIIYDDGDEDAIKNYVFAFNTSIKVNTANVPYKTDVSVGYGVSNETFESLNDVVKTSEYALYKSKDNDRDGADIVDENTASLNLRGLDNVMFDAFTISNNNDHPYILNLKTNVMRITTAWKEEFGIQNEIMYDLPTVWINHIHPDDRQNFIDDFTATVNGTQPSHNADYRSLNKDGKYIKCSCHGGVFKDDDGNMIFAGHMYTQGEAD